MGTGSYGEIVPALEEVVSGGTPRRFGDIHGMVEHMRKHAEIPRPKFEIVHNTLETELGDLGIGSWTNPKGGYFVSVNTAPGLAKRALALCKEAGGVMTSAGATYPYGHDPLDSNIRVAPSLPPVEELEQAMAVFCCCLKLAALEQAYKF